MRWYSLGVVSFQPSEFLKPGFIIVSAWLMAASAEINGPPGKLISFVLTVTVALFLAMQPVSRHEAWCYMALYTRSH